MTPSEAALLSRMQAHVSALMGDAALPDAVQDAATDAMLAGSLMLTTAALVPLILAAEAGVDAAKGVERDTRALLLSVLDQTSGAIRSGAHTASVANGKASVQIIDEALIPPSLMRTSPDKAAIERAIRAGGTVPGCVLSNGSGPQLRITTSKGAAA